MPAHKQSIATTANNHSQESAVSLDHFESLYKEIKSSLFLFHFRRTKFEKICWLLQYVTKCVKLFILTNLLKINIFLNYINLQTIMLWCNDFENHVKTKTLKNLFSSVYSSGTRYRKNSNNKIKAAT